MRFRIFTDKFDYNLRFLILVVLVRVLYDHIFRVRVRVHSTVSLHITTTVHHTPPDHTAAALRVQYEYRVLLKASSIQGAINYISSTFNLPPASTTGTVRVLHTYKYDAYCTRFGRAETSYEYIQNNRYKYKYNAAYPATFPPNNDSKFEYPTWTQT